MLLTYNQTAALKSTIFALCQHIFGALSTFFFIQFFPAIFCPFFLFTRLCNILSEVGTVLAHPPLPPSPFFKNISAMIFSIYARGSVFSIYNMLTKKIRIRKSSYEIIVDMIYRIELILLGKNKEFGKIHSETAHVLSDLLVAARAAKT